MATNKHAIIRYQTLDKCFRNPGRRYYIEDLIEACNNSFYEFTRTDIGIKRRQIFEDIKFMESPQGWNIPLERIRDGHKVYFKYEDKNFSINNQPLNETEENQLIEALLTLSRFKGMPQFEWEQGASHTLISLDLIPNYELESMILSYGEGMEVLHPKSLRDKIKKKIELISNNYDNKSADRLHTKA